MKMNRRTILILTLYLITLVSFATVVSAQAGIGESFNQLLGGKSAGEFYLNYSLIIDLIIYLFLFGYAGRLALQNQQGFKPLGVVVGVALAISAIAFEWQSNFRIGNMGPYALAVAAVIFGLVVWRFFHGLGFGGFTGAAWVWVFLYGSLLSVFQPLYALLQKEAATNAVWNFALLVMNVAFIVSAIAIVWGLFRKVPGLFGQQAGGAGPHLGPGGLFGGRGGGSPAERQQRAAELGTERQIDTEEVAEVKDEQRMMADLNRLNQLEVVEANFVKNMATNVDAIIKAIEKWQGRIGPEAANRFINAIAVLRQSSEKARNVTFQIEQTIVDLERAETVEIGLAMDALKKQIRAQVLAMARKQKVPKEELTEQRVEEGTMAYAAQFEKDVINKAKAAWVRTKTSLEGYTKGMESIERELPQAFLDAEKTLSQGTYSGSALGQVSIQTAIKQLEMAFRMLNKMKDYIWRAEDAAKYVVKVIRQELKETGNVRKMMEEVYKKARFDAGAD